ncbi:LysR substrate-binding domain-containing protein [Labrenzia sp. DG1229]|uniref:LysR substrate-binding domain-containing protein n=1 Tax=Labrenzia sp. DG1229 TaxID=681847 RepID=UPI00048F2C2F|nr:LysR substrate-binding domain-containing protein [Labrenzia sp. DG1229]
MAGAKNGYHSVQEYRALRAVLTDGTTAGAARLLGRSQPSVSRDLAKLEERLGTLLFERESGRLVPTQEAVSLDARLDSLFSALDELENVSAKKNEQLRIISSDTYAHEFLPRLISGFQENHPNMLITLEVAGAEVLLKEISAGNFDIGVSNVEQTRAGVKISTFSTNSAACAIPEKHKLSKKKVISMCDLNGQRIILPTYPHIQRSLFERHITESGIEVDIIAESSTFQSAVRFASFNSGIAIINPFPLSHSLIEGVVIRRLTANIVYNGYVFTPQENKLPWAARAFLRILKLYAKSNEFSA